MYWRGKETFWRAIDDHLRSFGTDEHVVIGGDLNGHVGHTRESYEQHHGCEGFGERNEGVSILDFAFATQIGYLLVRRVDLQHVMNCKVIPSDNIAPQHRLLIMDNNLKVGSGAKPRRTETDRIKWWRFKECKAELETSLVAMEAGLHLAGTKQKLIKLI